MVSLQQTSPSYAACYVCERLRSLVQSSAVLCVTELRIFHLLVVMYYSLFITITQMEPMCFSVLYQPGEVTLTYSNQCDLCDGCGLSANLLSDLKPLSQHRKHSDAGKAYQKIYCGHTHFTA